jgi:methylamine--corrinoid protein Co-methyltransferase
MGLRITPIEVYKRSLTGPKVKEEEWDLKIIPEATKSLVKEYGIKIERNTIIPDKDLADKIFEAGFKLLLELGVYNRTTARVIKVSEEEIKDGIKNAPKEFTIGAGKDSVRVVQRRVGGENYTKRPIIQGGPTGAPCSEKYFLPIHLSYAQEAIVDTIVNGVLSTYMGEDVTPNNPIEIKAVKLEQQLVRQACAMAGRPGMGV